MTRREVCVRAKKNRTKNYYTAELSTRGESGSKKTGHSLAADSYLDALKAALRIAEQSDIDEIRIFPGYTGDGKLFDKEGLKERIKRAEYQQMLKREGEQKRDEERKRRDEERNNGVWAVLKEQEVVTDQDKLVTLWRVDDKFGGQKCCASLHIALRHLIRIVIAHGKIKIFYGGHGRIGMAAMLSAFLDTEDQGQKRDYGREVEIIERAVRIYPDRKSEEGEQQAEEIHDQQEGQDDHNL